jgi:phosphatidylinositol-3-phosphatase
MGVERSELCEDCGSPLAGGQRYCLLCGARAGGPSPLLVELQRRVKARGGEDRERPKPEPPAVPAASSRRATSGLRLPSPRISALLVLVFVGFGALLGATAGTPVQDTLAASARRVKVVLPAQAPAAATSTTSGEAASPVSEPETPESEPAATPEAAATTTATQTTPAKAPASSEGGASKSGEGGESGEGSSSAGPATKLPPIKHVFVIVLSDEPYASVFGPISPAHYLSGTLEHRGTLLVRYDAVAHEELANGIALISGQGPTAETAANCPTYADVAPASSGADGQLLGSGCVYPASTETLPGQLTANHFTWRAYVQGTDESGTTAGACSHPAAGAADPSAAQTASTGPYATFRNPFVYFHSIADSPKCASDDVGLSQLSGDLASSSRTANLTYIVPDRCHDGNPTPCTPGAPAGLVQADAFLKQVVPKIMASKAYKQNGLLAITVDEAPSSGEFADSSSCCGQPSFPNVPPTGAAVGLSPRGGGTVGALLLSPYLKGATTNQEPYNHFSLLRTIEDLFGLKHLGYAALPAVKPFEAAMFSSRKLG